MSFQDIVESDLVQEKSTVWLLKGHSEFGYSDGVESERYLEQVFKNTDDLTSGSCELEKHIKDWPSEYHLSAKRAQLFAGFDFDPSLNALEVGCGCGAITRYLGETFSNVISIEGSIERARLARLRTKGLKSVSVICAPFQEIKFSGKFDIIFCVGVFEYSASFVPGDDPYKSVLRYFGELLTPDGIVVIAIENQFGLKYFNSSREDHTGTMYEGLEGYHAHGNKVKTFGRKELEDTLMEHFSSIEVFYPYPDYKLPSCVISTEFLSSKRAGELVSQSRSRDYYGEREKLWDESLVTLELSKNEMLPFFSNSFLVFAGKSEIVGASFDQLAIMTSSQRTECYRTRTRIYRDANGEIRVSKSPLSGENRVTIGKLSLVESHTVWQDSYSLQTILHRNCMSKTMQLGDMFSPCREWIEFLGAKSTCISGESFLRGEFVDCNFSNVYWNSGKISLIDNEWIWKEKVRVNVIVIRAIFTFLCNIESAGRLPKSFRVRSLRRLISDIAKSMGVNLGNRDFSDFIELESEFQSLVHGSGIKRHSRLLRWMLFDWPSFRFFRKLRVGITKVQTRIKRAIARVRGKM